MLFIKSFQSDLAQTDLLAAWLEEVAAALEEIPYFKLRFVVHEAFVNACKHAQGAQASIIVVIRHQDKLEIAITDPGKGFELPENLDHFDTAAIGFRWNLVSDRETSVVAEIGDAHTLNFHLSTAASGQVQELKENHRGLISILKATKNLSYHFVPNSCNYLHITC
ncbi:MAG TPA: hypothetical protein DIW47_03035 [Bacteroidetes bacterium]|nr:hypothetical protein [Bacteroidota bacterium]